MGFKVVALSQTDAKKELATKLGADVYLDGSKVNQVDELMKLGGAKCILATAPHGETISTLLGGLRVGGTMVTVASKPTLNIIHNFAQLTIQPQLPISNSAPLSSSESAPLSRACLQVMPKKPLRRLHLLSKLVSRR